MNSVKKNLVEVELYMLHFIEPGPMEHMGTRGQSLDKEKSKGRNRRGFLGCMVKLNVVTGDEILKVTYRF